MHGHSAERSLKFIPLDLTTLPPDVPITEEEIMEEHPSYHQCITSEEAKQRLKKHGGCCYLTRYSESQKKYFLNVFKDKPTHTYKHYEIMKKRRMYWIDGKKKKFRSIKTLLEHYETTRIDTGFPTIGECYTEDQYLVQTQKRCCKVS